jgi:acetylornithine deacetylase/succinyl-diaminopimelate desuccinylase-like protein
MRLAVLGPVGPPLTARWHAHGDRRPGRLQDAHAVNESVEVAQLQRAVRVYAHIAQALLS